MGKIHPEIGARLSAFIEAQPVFFVGTSPLASDGHVNVSPKGGAGTLVVLDPHSVAYLDVTGSGSETIAHLRENGRIVIMLCAFTGPATIVRLHGVGRVVLPADAEFAALAARFPADRGARAVIVVDVRRVSDSCGFQVPLLEHVGDRDLLTQWSDRKTDAELAAYRATRNAASIDGLPALDQRTGSSEAIQ
ncbi:MAG TPA: pyridoxamine 5'-phosphate oxidase family protein [Cellulomonas sp.]|uniref:pyridoxamine 5'-phosphate oxidase family protein n=1 Tax=Cellulomonas sp. TaxID=40001 RepID=UPI002E3189AB|nr:pyridoxamine 5'-phosphate oxidase family protein [Cellulomonas sp.]HEX5332361.1 pyridoxamine 5'-phosphate oxidase family protein [Cellulomonas sp.]